MTPKRNDQVFQLSLTEVALILIFLLMLLLGWLTKAAQKNAEEAKAELAAIEGGEIVRDELDRAKEALRKALERANVADPDKLFEDLVRYSAMVAKNKQLEGELEKAQRELRDLQKIMETLGGPMGVATLEEVAEEIKKAAARKQKNKDLHAQNVYWRKLAGKGFGIQPCWVANGKTQNLLAIVLEPDGVAVSIPRKLPEERIKQMQQLPGIDLATRAFIPYRQLAQAFGPILAWTKRQEPECRHYVAIKSNIPETKISTPRRLQITGYFYPNEYK